MTSLDTRGLAELVDLAGSGALVEIRLGRVGTLILMDRLLISILVEAGLTIYWEVFLALVVVQEGHDEERIIRRQ